MTIGEGIAQGGHNYLNRMEQAREFNASLAEKRRAVDQSAFVSLANSSKKRIDNSDEKLAEERRQFDASQRTKQQELAQKQSELDMRESQWNQAHAWDDAYNQQRINTLKAEQDERMARMEHYQQLEEQMRQQAADLREERHSADRDMCMLAYNNGGFITSPEVLEDFRGRFKANDLQSISNAGFFYNQDGTIKVKQAYKDKNGVLHPVNDDGKEPYFGYSFTYIDPQTGKVAVDPQTGRPKEMIRVPQGQTDWIAQFNSGSTYTSSGRGVRSASSSSGTRGGLTFDQQKELRSLGSEGKADKQLFDQRMSLMKNYQDRYDKIAALNPQDSRLEGLQKKIDQLGGYLGVSTGISGADELSRAFGLTGGEAELAEDKGEYFVEGNREDGTKRVMDETQTDPKTGRLMKTGRKVINTDYERKDGSTSYALGEGEKEYESETGNVVTVRNGRVIARKANEGEMPEYDEDNARTTYTLDGGQKLLVPDGKVVQMQNGQRYKSEGGRLVPTTDKISWDEAHSESLMQRIASDKEAEANRVAAENAKKENEKRRIREERVRSPANTFVDTRDKTSPTEEAIRSGIDKAVVSAAKSIANAVAEGSIAVGEQKQVEADALNELIKSGKVTLFDILSEIATNLKGMDSYQKDHPEEVRRQKDRNRFYDIRSGKSSK